MNHRRNQAVTWVSSALPLSTEDDGIAESDSQMTYRTKQERCVGLVVRAEVEEDEQVFNNYGPKGSFRSHIREVVLY
jgi:hypothetical protein